eukprot:TRINITY_DN5367_c0_g1_i1.p1 TRINITY_DN5367_c0_g1~~TRINITY_DN5367_c0_g1_i1.p1  ORF type:complete len:125 (+),score=19.96 TRINITY_DN5367_c0_g1_i1:45-377(+)
MAGRELLVNSKNPNITTSIAIAAGVVVGAYALPSLTVAVIRALGFTAGGVAKGSLAALIQGPLILARSLFAIAQSIGATGGMLYLGLGPQFMTVAGALLGAVIVYYWRRR